MTDSTRIDNEDEPKLTWLPAGEFRPHPRNPRLTLREDVVAQIAFELGRSGFGVQHAVTARPVEGGVEIVSGHHRVEAARRAGVEVPAWLVDMDDDEAFMQLALSNSQGELTPLEIGMHALAWSGEQQEYASRTGFGKAYVSQLRSAAQVASVYSSKPDELRGKTKHLYEVSKAPRDVWSALVDALSGREWTVADTASHVGVIQRLYEAVPDGHAYWLPADKLAAAYLKSGRTKPTAVANLVSAADAAFHLIDAEGTDDDRESFVRWLTDNSGADAWDVKAIRNQHQAIQAAIWGRRDDAETLPESVDIRAGDFRQVLDLEPGTVDAIITDPPYPAEYLDLFTDLSEVSARLLKPGGVCAVMVGQSYLPEIMQRLGSHLDYHWTVAYLTPGGQATQLWQRKVNTFWKPVLIYANGEYSGDWIGDVTSSDVNDNDKDHHFWGQSESGTADLVNRLSKPGELVCDPFLGGGTTAVVCHELGRRFVGCDIEDECVETTAGRFGAGEDAA